MIKVRVSFSKSRSKQYENVLAKCTLFNCFSSSNGSNSIDISVEELFEKWEQFTDIVSIAGGWSTFKFETDDHQFAGKEFWFMYYSIKRLKDCYDKKGISEYTELYCRNFNFSCSQLTSLTYDPESFYGIQWYKLGHFSDDYSTWIIHKVDIFNHLQKEIISKQIVFCPSFNIESLRSQIDSLPNEIILPGNRFYRIEYRKRYSGGVIVETPYSITHRFNDDGDDEDPSPKNPFTLSLGKLRL